MSVQGLHTIAVTGLDDPRVAAYANLRDAELARRGGLFIAEGPLVVTELIRSRHAAQSVLIHEEKVQSMRDVLGMLAPSVPIYTAPPALIDGIVGFPMHRGVLACGKTPPPLDAMTLARESGVLVVLEDLTNHDNVGGLFRVAAALGSDRCGVILSPRCCDPLYRKALRVSIGHALRVPFARAELDGPFWESLASLGYTLIATDPTLPHRSPAQIGRPERVAIVLGSEGPGLRPQTTRALLGAGGLNARIPMTPGVDSLNVVVAAGILLSHAVAPKQGGRGVQAGDQGGVL